MREDMKRMLYGVEVELSREWTSGSVRHVLDEESGQYIAPNGKPSRQNALFGAREMTHSWDEPVGVAPFGDPFNDVHWMARWCLIEMVMGARAINRVMHETGSSWATIRGRLVEAGYRELADEMARRRKVVR